MAKQGIPNDAIQVGNNVYSWELGDFLVFAVDRSQAGVQTEGSKALDKKGNPKRPNEMVGSTRSFTPVQGCSVLLHLTRPMKVQDVRKARAVAELDADEGSVEQALAILKAAGVDTGELGK